MSFPPRSRQVVCCPCSFMIRAWVWSARFCETDLQNQALFMIYKSTVTWSFDLRLINLRAIFTSAGENKIPRIAPRAGRKESCSIGHEQSWGRIHRPWRILFNYKEVHLHWMCWLRFGMLRHLAQLDSQFCQIPICPSWIRQTVQQARS